MPNSENVLQEVEFPFDMEDPEASLVAGDATLTFATGIMEGTGRVFLNMLPVPCWQFTFTPDGSRSGSNVLRDIVQLQEVHDARLEFAGDKLAFDVSLQSKSKVFGGRIEGTKGEDQVLCQSISLGILNGPSTFPRRLMAKYSGHTVTIKLRNENISAFYAPTHVAKIDFDAPVQKSDWEKAHTAIFWTLSLMRGGWVGLVGSWLDGPDDPKRFPIPTVTKVTRPRKGRTWYHEQIDDAFELLYPLVYRAINESAQREALLTAMHWTVEANECAGGDIGSIVLQQCALECLAWQQLVVCRNYYSRNAFGSLSTSEKLERLCDEFKIVTQVPEEFPELMDYASEAKVSGLLCVLVRVRNSLVHAEPTKVRKLFERVDGDDERSSLWYLMNSILQQALLASLGYTGRFYDRVQPGTFSVDAIRDVPWKDSETTFAASDVPDRSRL